jgi:hypothetical protein
MRNSRSRDTGAKTRRLVTGNSGERYSQVACSTSTRTLVAAKRRVIILTEQDMCDQCEKDAAGGRVPKQIEFVCIPIPEKLRTRLVAARLKAPGEFSNKPHPVT